MIYDKKLFCDGCNKTIEGKAIISYSWDSNHFNRIEGISAIHEECQLVASAKKKGLKYECPKCNGKGSKLIDEMLLNTTKDNKISIVYASQLYKKPNSFEGSMESIKKITKICDLCSGDGFLEKEPIPVITDWKRG